MKRILPLLLVLLIIAGCNANANINNEVSEQRKQDNIDPKTGEKIYNDEYVLNKITSSDYTVIDYFKGKQPKIVYSGRSGKGDINIVLEGLVDDEVLYSDDKIDVLLKPYEEYSNLANIYLKNGEKLFSPVVFIEKKANLSNGDILKVNLNIDEMKKLGYISDIEPFQIRVTKLPELFKKGDKIDIEKVKKLIADKIPSNYGISVNEIKIKNILLTECIDENKIMDEVTSKVGKYYNYVSVYFDCGIDVGDSNTFSFVNLYDNGEEYKCDTMSFLYVKEDEDIKTCFEEHIQMGDGYESTIIY